MFPVPNPPLIITDTPSEASGTNLNVQPMLLCSCKSRLLSSATQLDCINPILDCNYIAAETQGWHVLHAIDMDGTAFDSDNPLYPNYNRPGNPGKRKSPGEEGKPGKVSGSDGYRRILWIGPFTDSGVMRPALAMWGQAMVGKGEAMADVSPWLQTVIGGGMTLAGGALTHWMTVRRERDARRHEAEEHRNRQRADFQIKTLMDLQDALCRVMASAYPISDIDYHETFSGVERDKEKSSRLWKEWQDALSLATVCRARVQDPQIREGVGEILKMASSLMIPLRRKGSDLDQSREDAEELRETLIESFDRINERIGERLHKLY
jgi:hypothetical protein